MKLSNNHVPKICTSASPWRTFVCSPLQGLIQTHLFTPSFQFELKTLVSMRRTCETIKIIIEKRLQRLASRPHLGISIKIIVFKSRVSWRSTEKKTLCCQKIAVYSTKPARLIISPTESYNEDVAKKLSGITFNTIEVVWFTCGESSQANERIEWQNRYFQKCEYGGDHCQRLVDFLGQMKPMCRVFHGNRIPIDYIVSATDQINYSQRYYITQGYHESTDTFFKTLQLVRTLLTFFKEPF